MNEFIDISIAKEKVQAILDLCLGSLCEDAVSEIVHYIEHNEPEIAFEGLFIELIQLGVLPKNVDKTSCIELGEYLNLDSESVLGDEFWSKFIAFLA
ncbi:hypothetical protein ABT56_14410 [Photobacterium aquae]|uniref:MafI family immunity protein n=1 Tax=Photobacterium aquae TaxID=1195763 RepID=A0A0J1JQV1_9GAMM|nr:hypothetical protein [Photobacterium aquae]KLV04647.1 hypothetical protein ABT56_14410 [Photobacterium aquae]